MVALRKQVGVRVTAATEVEVVGAPAGPANGMSKRFEFNPGALAPVAASWHRHNAQSGG